jgi:transposase
MNVSQGLSFKEIAERMAVSESRLYHYIMRHPENKKMRRECDLFPQLNTMNVGDSFVVPKVEDRTYNYTRYYNLVRRLGIRVSVTTASKTEMRVTRVG